MNPDNTNWRTIVNADKTIDTARLPRGGRIKIHAKVTPDVLAGMQMKFGINEPPVTGTIVDRAILAVDKAAIAAGNYSIEFKIATDAGETVTRVVPMRDLDTVYAP